MGKLITIKWREKLLMCIGLLIFSLLFIGAGRVTQKLSERMESKKSEHSRWEEILNTMSSEIPPKYKDEWKEILKKDPDSLINAITAN